MKRSPELAGLSRDHHQALSVALLLRRASSSDQSTAVERFSAYFDAHGADHFDVEEELLGPALGRSPIGATQFDRMLSEHARLRELGAAATAPEPATDTLRELGEMLAAHVRFEEREVFPFLEDELTGAELAELGRALRDRGHG